jgi:inhibitor of growth protein 3
MAHQKHISNLLAASSLLERAPPSPYTQSLALTNIPVYSTSRRQARAANSPFGGRGYASASVAAAAGEPKDTPTKKKNRRVQQLGREDDEVSSVGGEKKKAPVKKRKP